MSKIEEYTKRLNALSCFREWAKSGKLLEPANVELACLVPNETVAKSAVELYKPALRKAIGQCGRVILAKAEVILVAEVRAAAAAAMQEAEEIIETVKSNGDDQ